MLGRIVWSSTSDYIGRRNAYWMYLGVGLATYLVVALTTNGSRSWPRSNGRKRDELEEAAFAYGGYELIRKVTQLFG